MKNLILFFSLAFALTSIGQEKPAVKASQAEVDAGSNDSKFVTAKTLANKTGTVALGSAITGSNSAAVVLVLGLDVAGKLATNDPNVLPVVFTNVTLATVSNAALTISTNGGTVATPANAGPLSANDYARSISNPGEYLSSASWSPIADFEGDYGPAGGGVESEAIFKSNIDAMVTNGLVSAGYDWYQLSDAWATNSGGVVVPHATAFPNGIAPLVEYAHSNGVKVLLYVGLGNATSAGNTGYSNNFVRAAWDCLTNFNADGAFIGESPQSASLEGFTKEIAKSGKRFYIHSPASGATNSPNWSPFLSQYVNSWYPASPGMQDPVSPNNFTNFFAHLDAQIAASGTTRPGHFTRGAANVSNLGQPDYRLYRMQIESAVALSAVFSYNIGSLPGYRELLTNSEVLSLHRDPNVSAARVMLSVATNGVTNCVLSKSLWPDKGTNALVWAYWRDTNTANFPMQITTTNLHFQNPVITYSSPWSHAIEGWATNTLTLNSIGAWTNRTTPASLLYKVVSGFVLPPFSSGTNYLSDQFFRLNTTNGTAAFPVFKNTRDNGAALIVNSVTYTKGLYMVAPAFCEFPVGGAAQTFSTVFGILDAFAGGTNNVRLTILTNGVQAFQTGYITNANQSTNISFSMTGVMDIGLAVDSATITTANAAVIGNCYVLVPTVGVYDGVFQGALAPDNVVTVGTVAGDLVVSSNVTFYANDFNPTGDFLDALDKSLSETPVFYEPTIKISKTGNGGIVRQVPNWVTNAVITATYQWSGTGPLTFTNNCDGFYYPGSVRVSASAPVVVSTFTNHLTEITWTNTWPDTNCLKSIRTFHGAPPTNTSAFLRLLKWQVKYAGNPNLQNQ